MPTRHRNHNGYFLRWDDMGFLFDPGEGTQRQMIHYGVTASSIHAVLITHFHGDHCLGLPSIVQRMSLDGVSHPVRIGYPASGETYYQRLRHASIFFDRVTTQAIPLSKPGLCFETDKLRVMAESLDHGVDCLGWRIEEKDHWVFDRKALVTHGVSGPAVGQLEREGELTIGSQTVHIEDVAKRRQGQVFALVMDTRMCESAVRLARDTDLLVIESTYLESEAKEAHEHGHLTAAQAATIAKEAGAREVVLTHFSQRYHQLNDFSAQAGAIHDSISVASDGDRFPVPARRC